MKKSHAFNVLSDRVCITPGCEKYIKQRMVNQKDAVRCYDCERRKEANRGHFINMNPRKKRIDKGLPVKDFKRHAVN